MDWKVGRGSFGCQTESSWGQALKADQKEGHAFKEDRKAGSQGEDRKVWGGGALSKMINKKNNNKYK